MEMYKKLKSVPFLILSVLFALIPIFFIPLPSASFEFGKMSLLVVGVFLATILFLISALKSGTLNLPGTFLWVAAYLIAGVYLVSALFSNVSRASLFGYGFEVSTFTSIFFLATLMFVVAVSFRSPKKLFSVYGLFIAVSILLALFHLARLFLGVDFLSFGFFPSIISNTIGKWNELGIFFGASTLLSLVALDMLRLRPMFRISLWVMFVLSLIMMIFVNLNLVWAAVGIFSLSFFFYVLVLDSKRRGTLNVVDSEGSHEVKMKTTGRTVSFRSLVVVALSILFIFTPIGPLFGEKISTSFGVNNIEVRPSWLSTWQIAEQTFKNDPALGAGPNRFGIQWQSYRPDVNQTNFWNINFETGIGFIPTSIVETGMVGLAAWVLFFICFAALGIRMIFKNHGDRFSVFFSISSLLIAKYLWLMAIIYSPTITILALTFFFTGIAIAASCAAGTTPLKTIPLFVHRRASIVSISALLIAIIAFSWLFYVTMEKAISFSYFRKASFVSLDSRADLDTALGFLQRAENISSNDIYYRSISEASTIRLNNIISSVNGVESISEEVKNDFQTTLATALEAARRAQLWDPEKYENWLSLASVYGAITPIGLESAPENAHIAFDEALKRSPRNPAIYLSMARFEANQNNTAKAKENINKALVLKENYAEALLFLSQIQAGEGDLEGAIRSTEQMLASYPNDPNVYFRLGILKYEMQRYTNAAADFEKALVFTPNHANARYFLGLTYQKLNRTRDAIAQFEEVLKTNPGNQDVLNILSELRGN